ncbi:MAG TPA: SBBP repeat-containing protein, partial [Bacteroidia bacterium]
MQLQAFSQSPHSLIRFTENKHQWQDFILYRAQLDGGALYAEENTLTYSFYDKETYRSAHDNPKAKPAKTIKTTGFRVSFLNSNKQPQIESFNASKDYNNYFIGNDKSHWASNAKNYQKLLYTGLWKNINLEMLGQDNSVKYNFYVKPGGNPDDIQLFYDKTEKISLQKKQLIIKTSLDELVEHEPYAYQIIDGKTVEVPCNFQLKKNTVSFSFPKGYNKEYELVIDPVLVFACTSGSTADNFGFCATYDPQGNLYSGGIAFEAGYPVVNAYDNTFNGVGGNQTPDVVITKYDSSGTFLHYSTYLGGANSSETVTGLIVDSQNNLFLFGATGSNDFPITSNAYSNTFNGGVGETFTGSGTYFNSGTDIYVAKLSAGGNQLLASTFIGGIDNDGLNINNLPSSSGGEAASDSLQYNYGDQYRGDILLDNLGNLVISSCTRSINFPFKHGFDSTLGGWQDAVLFKFNPSLSQLLWSTFIGGSNNEGGYGLIIGKD